MSETHLTHPEINELKEKEQIIARGLKGFVEVGNALVEIREKRLYREGYGSFQDYCREKWDLGRSAAYQMINASEVVGQLQEAGCTEVPANEAQARELNKIKDPQLRTDIWNELVEEHGAESITAKHIRLESENFELRKNVDELEERIANGLLDSGQNYVAIDKLDGKTRFVFFFEKYGRKEFNTANLVLTVRLQKIADKIGEQGVQAPIDNGEQAPRVNEKQISAEDSSSNTPLSEEEKRRARAEGANARICELIKTHDIDDGAGMVLSGECEHFIISDGYVLFYGSFVDVDYGFKFVTNDTKIIEGMKKILVDQCLISADAANSTEIPGQEPVNDNESVIDNEPDSNPDEIPSGQTNMNGDEIVLPFRLDLSLAMNAYCQRATKLKKCPAAGCDACVLYRIGFFAEYLRDECDHVLNAREPLQEPKTTIIAESNENKLIAAGYRPIKLDEDNKQVLSYNGSNYMVLAKYPTKKAARESFAELRDEEPYIAPRVIPKGWKAYRWYSYENEHSIRKRTAMGGWGSPEHFDSLDELRIRWNELACQADTYMDSDTP